MAKSNYTYTKRGDAIVHLLGSQSTILKNVEAVRDAARISVNAAGGDDPESLGDYKNLEKRLNRLANKLEKLAQEAR